MAKTPKRIPPIKIDPAALKAAKLKSVENDTTISEAIRGFIESWARGDKNALAIVERAKQKK